MLWRLGFVLLLFGWALPVFAQEYFINQVKYASTQIKDCSNPLLDDSQWPQINIHNLPQGQLMCLRTTITIDLKDAIENAALVINMLGAREIYLDGQLLARDGHPDINQALEIPGPIRSQYLLPKQNSTLGPHQLAIIVSNFHINESVTYWFYSLSITDYASALKLPMAAIGPAVFFVGALVLIFFIFQMLFWFYQRRSSYQVFSLMCLSAAGLLFAEHYRDLFGYNYDWHLWRLHWIMALTFTAMFLLPLFYLLFYRLPYIRYWLVAIIAGLTIALLLDPRYDAKSLLMFAVASLLCLLVNLAAWRRQQQGAITGSIMFAAIVVAFFMLPLTIIYSFIEQWFAFIYFVIIMTIVQALIGEMNHNRRQALASERLAADLLKHNLHPHFLMNSLMLIIEWIEHKPAAAVEFVQSLSTELRMLIHFSAQKEVTLTEEIELCRRHLEIMSYRYSCHYELKVTGAIDNINIPPAILHTQIENAFSHNRIADGAVFQLDISIEKTAVMLELRSPYRAKSSEKHLGTGTGEQYIKARLQERFDQHFKYQSYSANDHWINRITYFPAQVQPLLKESE